MRNFECRTSQFAFLNSHFASLADQLKKALITYTESGGQGNPTFDTAQAIAVMLEKHGIACDLMHGFNWDKWTSGKPTERLALIPAGQEHILEQEDVKKPWVQVVTELLDVLPTYTMGVTSGPVRTVISLHKIWSPFLTTVRGLSTPKGMNLLSSVLGGLPR